MKKKNVPAHLWNFASHQDRLARASDAFKALLDGLLDDSALVPFSVIFRAKGFDSYEAKSKKLREDGTPKYTGEGNEIMDCVAGRAIVFTEQDYEAVINLIDRAFELKENRDPGEEKSNGYQSRHLIVSGAKNSILQRLPEDVSWYLDHFSYAEIQVRTIAAHAWAEFEHHTRYKAQPSGYSELSANDSKRVDLLFTQAAGSREEMDRRFRQIGEILVPTLEGSEAASEPTIAEKEALEDLAVYEIPRADNGTLGARELLNYISERYPGADRQDPRELEAMSDILIALKISSTDQLNEVLGLVNSKRVKDLMQYVRPASPARRLEDDLLSTLTDEYLAVASEDRRLALRSRLLKLQGKTKIYQLVGPSVPVAIAAARLSGARALRELVKLVAEGAGPKAVAGSSYVSLEANLPPSSRPVRVVVEDQIIWVYSILNREICELEMKRILRNAAGMDISVERAGDVVAKTDLNLQQS